MIGYSQLPDEDVVESNVHGPCRLHLAEGVPPSVYHVEPDKA